LTISILLLFSKVILIEIKKIKFLKKKQICQVELDNDELLFVSMDLLIKFKINTNKAIDESTLSQIKKKQRIIDAKRSSLNYISFKPRTEKQTRDKLLMLGFNSNEIETCISFLKDFDYLNDNHFAERYIKDRINRKPISKRKLFQDLIKKGVPREITEKYVNLFFKDEYDFENAKKKLEKVRYKLKQKNDAEQKNYIFNYLLRQGFKPETIKEVIKDYLSNTNNL